MYSHITEDCVSIFTNIPELFCLRTSFGSCGSSHVSLLRSCTTQFSKFKQDCDAQCQDVHLAAISLLYETAIFMHCTQNNEWHRMRHSNDYNVTTVFSLYSNFPNNWHHS